MKTIVPALAILAAVLPACAAAQERAPELPEIGRIIRELGRSKDSHAQIRTGAAEVACLAWTPTVQVGRGVFQNDYTVNIAGRDEATVEVSDDGYVLKDKSGFVEARAVISGGQAKRTAVITGCNGAPLGAIEELVRSGSSAFNIKGPDGAPLMTTGWVDGGDMAASAPKASMKVEQNGIFDHFTVTINGVAPQVGVFAAVMNNAAGYARAQERTRERMGEGPHGRAGR